MDVAADVPDFDPEPVDAADVPRSPSPVEEQPSLNDSFNITALIEDDNPEVQESPVPDRSMSTTILEDRIPDFQIVDSGTKRGGKKLITSDGFSYTLKRSSGRRSIWRCSIRNKNLRCHVTVAQMGEDFITKGDHVHQPDPAVLKKTLLSKQVKSMASENIFRSATSIAEDALEETVDEEDFLLPAIHVLKRQANRHRQSLRPKDPGPTETMFEINHGFLEDDFLRDEVVVDNQRHLIFSTPTQIELLERSRRWFLDGTFKIVKRPFVQLWSVHAFIHKDEDIKQVPLVFVLMTRRTQADYVKILQSILSLITPVIPEVAVLDFEMALWQALRVVIPTITLKGCIFHWSQCIWRKIQSLGLQTTYMERRGPYQFMRKLMALPFLPADHIDPAFRAVRERSNTPNLVELTTYVAEQWMQSPVYPMQSLSVFNHVIRTNNDVEGWHRRMNARASGQGLPFYVLVPYLHQEAQHVRQQVRLVQDNLLTRDNCHRYCPIQSMLEDLWERYSMGTINTSKFLLRAAAVYGTL